MLFLVVVVVVVACWKQLLTVRKCCYVNWINLFGFCCSSSIHDIIIYLLHLQWDGELLLCTWCMYEQNIFQKWKRTEIKTANQQPYHHHHHQQQTHNWSLHKSILKVNHQVIASRYLHPYLRYSTNFVCSEYHIRRGRIEHITYSK